MGQRLSAAGDENSRKDALLCFIIAGNVNHLVDHWKSTRSGSSAEIQVFLRSVIWFAKYLRKIGLLMDELSFFKKELAELGLLMKEAVKSRGINVTVDGALANVLLQYAELLVSQGYLKEAYSYLGESNEVGEKTSLLHLMQEPDLVRNGRKS